MLSACGAEHFSGGSLDAAGSPADAAQPIDTDDSDGDGSSNGGGSGGATPEPTGGNGGGGAGSGGAPGTGGMMVAPTDGGGDDSVRVDAAMDKAGGPMDAAPVTHPATLTGPHQTMLVGNAAGGSANQDDCPAGQALVGFDGALSPTMMVNRQIAAHCGVIGIDGTTVTIKPGATLPARGMVGMPAWTRTCPANQVVIGFSGRTGTLVDQLVFSCAPLTASSAAVGTALMAGAETALMDVGGPGGTAFAAIKCAAGEVGSGSLVRTGTEMDAFSLICSKAAIAP